MDLAVTPVSGRAGEAQAAAPPSRAADAPAFTAALAPAAAARGEPPAPEAFRRFEAMVLGQFVEAMLPKDADAAYGGGLAGDMWRGLAAEKIADEMATRGGVGIARHLLRDHYAAQGMVGPAQDASSPGAR